MQLILTKLSAVNSSTFANKKPNLTGTITPQDPVQTLSYTTPIGSGGANVLNFFTEHVIATISLVAGEPFNAGFMRQTQWMPFTPNTNKTFRIREDSLGGTELASQVFLNNTAVTMDISTAIQNQPVGNRDYVITLEMPMANTGDGYAIDGSTVTLVKYILDITNTQNTKNANIIGG